MLSNEKEINHIKVSMGNLAFQLLSFYKLPKPSACDPSTLAGCWSKVKLALLEVLQGWGISKGDLWRLSPDQQWEIANYAIDFALTKYQMEESNNGK